MKITPREKRRYAAGVIFLSPRRVSPFLAWGDFHARSRFARVSLALLSLRKNGGLLVVYSSISRIYKRKVLTVEIYSQYARKNLDLLEQGPRGIGR